MPKTSFRPDVHGFAFVNHWSFDPSELGKMEQTMHSSVEGAIGSLTAQFAPLTNNLIAPIVNQFLGNAQPVSYGLCGGMAFAALDYYRLGKPLPRGSSPNDQPTSDTPSGKQLRDYLWQRQLESMAPISPQLLTWMFMLHSIIPMVGGADWLLDQTKEEWSRLKHTIDQSNPVPLCLVGSSHNPFDNHQVLAYGYQDPGDGTGVLYLYDMNCPNREITTHLDFRGKELVADEQCRSTARGNLRGFFCGNYVHATPPDIE